MQEVYDFLKRCQTYYLATMDGDQPRVRPFGTINLFDEKLYIQTGKIKDVSKQMMTNPKIEIVLLTVMNGLEYVQKLLRMTASRLEEACWIIILNYRRYMQLTMVIPRFFTYRMRKQPFLPLQISQE